MYRSTRTVLATLIAVAPGAALADGSRPGLGELWSRAKLYEGGGTVESVQLTGRFQADQAFVDAAQGNVSEANLRRLRFGFKAGFKNGFTAHVEADYDPGGGNLNYTRLTDAYIAWSPSDAVELTLGKQGAKFTLDGMTSSKELLTVDRSNLANNLWFTEEYLPGMSVAGDIGRFSYQTGVYSSGTRSRGFGDSDGGELWIGTVGYDFAAALAADTALLRANFVDNDPHPANGFTHPLERVISLNFVYERGRLGISADIAAADGYFGQSDLRGASVMPSIKLGEALQLVLRYTYVSSDEANGVRLPRYENGVVEGRGDHYRELYAGANYYWLGHKLKLQSGLQHATLADRASDDGRYRGWSWTTGLRIAW